MHNPTHPLCSTSTTIVRPWRAPWPLLHRYAIAVFGLAGVCFLTASCDPDVRKAKKELEHTTPAVRAKAAVRLARLEGKEAISHIGPLVNDRSATVRLAAVKALRSIESKKTSVYLQTAVRDADPEIRLSAVRGLGELGDRRATGVLLNRLEDPNPVVRRAARFALEALSIDRREQVARLAARARRQWVARLAEHRAVPTRKAALFHLSLHDDPQTNRLLYPLLKSDNPEIVKGAAAALGRLGGKKAQKRLIETLKSPHVEVRKSATHGLLTLMEWNPVTPRTVALLFAPAPAVRQRAATKLWQAAAKKQAPAVLSTIDLCPLLADARQATAVAAAKLVHHYQKKCPLPTALDPLRRARILVLWDRPLGSIDLDTVAAWCRKHLPDKRARSFFDHLVARTVKHAKKSTKTPLRAKTAARARAVLEALRQNIESVILHYRRETEKWLTEKQWQGVETHFRAQPLGPRPTPPGDEKSRALTRLLAPFPRAAARQPELLPARVSTARLKKALFLLSALPQSRLRLARLALAKAHTLRQTALQAMGEVTDTSVPSPQAVEAVKKATAADASLRVAAARALGGMGRYGLSVLFQLLAKDPNPEVRKAAARSLARIGSLKVRAPLRRAAAKRLELATIRALHQLEDPKAAPILLEQLKKNPPEVLLQERLALVEALGDLGTGNKELVAALIDELNHPHWTLREAAATSLGKLGARGAIDALSARQADFYKPVRAACKKALARIAQSEKTTGALRPNDGLPVPPRTAAPVRRPPRPR